MYFKKMNSLLILFFGVFTSLCGCMEKYENEQLVFSTLNANCVNSSIILIPGLAGSQLMYREVLSKISSHTSTNSTNHNSYYSLWIDPLKLLRQSYKDYLKPHYNPEKNTIEDYPGISIDTTSHNSTDAVEFLTPNYEFILDYWSKYYSHIINHLKYKHCFQRNVDLFALPYDFHKPRLEELFKRQQQLVENIYNKTNKKIIFISHSLGGPLTNMFLNRMDTEWKAKFIHGWFSINGVFKYDVVALSVVVLGDNPFIKYILPKSDIQRICSAMPSIYSLMPNPKVTDPSKVIAIVDGVEYTVKDLFRLFNVTKVAYGKEMSQLAEPIFECFKHDVHTNFVYSNGFRTKHILTLNKQLDESYTEGESHYTDGDGTVSLESLKPPSACDNLIRIQPLKTLIQNVKHLDVLFNPTVLENLTNFLRAINNT